MRGWLDEIVWVRALMERAPTQAAYEAADDLLVALGDTGDEGWDAPPQDELPLEDPGSEGGPRERDGRFPAGPPERPFGTGRVEDL